MNAVKYSLWKNNTRNPDTLCKYCVDWSEWLGMF